MILSPNYSPRGEYTANLLVLHYTGMKSAEEAVSRLCDSLTKVSAHYVVEEDGKIHRLVDEQHCAWHAGVSFWRGHRNVNEISIGIELVNPGHEWGYRAYPKAQMEAVASLCKEITLRHAISPRNVVGHSDVAPQRKADPGELFDWAWLAAQGVGLWPFEHLKNVSLPEELRIGDEGQEVLWMQATLASYGYQVPQTGQFDILTKNVVIAFQRHFLPEHLTGIWTRHCAARLEALLEAVDRPAT